VTVSLTHRGRLVLAAAFGIDLALGGLDGWTALANRLLAAAPDGFGWTPLQVAWPVMVAATCFVLSVFVGGRLADTIGARWTATGGGVLGGLGIAVTSLSAVRLRTPDSLPLMMIVGFGLMAGTGIGLAFSATTPAAVKWFRPQRRGLVAGVVLSGFALASILASTTTHVLIDALGFSRGLLVLGALFVAAVVGLAQLLEDPPHGYVPPGAYLEPPGAVPRVYSVMDLGIERVARSRGFWLLWLANAFSTFAGVACVATVAHELAPGIGYASPLALVPTALALFSAGAAGARPLWGAVSDQLGRLQTLRLAFVGQALTALAAGFAHSQPALLASATLLGATFGATLALLPTATYDIFGTRNAGADYGLIFTGWGVGAALGTGATLAIFAVPGSAFDQAGLAFLTCAVAAVVCGIAGLLVWSAGPAAFAAAEAQRQTATAVAPSRVRTHP
jgi:MFS transporter, OFA family, oxalate/formate antiporter